MHRGAKKEKSKQKIAITDGTHDDGETSSSTYSDYFEGGDVLFQPETLLYIFTFFDAHTLIYAVPFVCHSWYNLWKDAFVQHKIEEHIVAFKRRKLLNKSVLSQIDDKADRENIAELIEQKKFVAAKLKESFLWELSHNEMVNEGLACYVEPLCQDGEFYFTWTSEIPQDKDFKPQGYLLIKNTAPASHKEPKISWQLIYTDSQKKKTIIDVDKVPNLEEALKKLPNESKREISKQDMTEVKKAIASYHATIPTNLIDAIYQFIANDKKESLLIFGDSGLGKSITCYYLVQQLWNYSEEANFIPLYIYLPAIPKSKRNGHLLEFFFKKNQIIKDKIDFLFLKKYCRFLVFIDGLDETVHLGNLYEQNDWQQWQLKVVTFTRPEALVKRQENRKYRKLFVTKKGKRSLKELSLLPFSLEQVNRYLQQYVRLQRKKASQHEEHRIDWNDYQYEYYLNIIPGLSILAGIPFLLKMLAEILPNTVAHHEAQGKNIREIERAIIYDDFVEQWFERQANRLQRSGNTKAIAKLDNLSLSVKQYMWIYAENLAAYALSQTQVDEPIKVTLDEADTVQLSLLKPRPHSAPQGYREDDLDIFKEDPDLIKLIRSGCLLRSSGGQFSFIHKTLIEHLAARDLLNSAAVAIDIWLNEKIVKERKTPDESQLFSEQLLTDKPDILNALADQIKADKKFKKLLYKIIRFSSVEPRANNASANAITALRYAGADLKRDFEGVSISGADLSFTNLSLANFSYANVRGVRFANSCLLNTNFNNALVSDAFFAENIQQKLSSTDKKDKAHNSKASNFDDSVIADNPIHDQRQTQTKVPIWLTAAKNAVNCAEQYEHINVCVSPSNSYLAVAKGGDWIEIYATENWQRTVLLMNPFYRSLDKNKKLIPEALCFDTSQQFLAIAYSNGQMQLWDIQKQELIGTFFSEFRAKNWFPFTYGNFTCNSYYLLFQQSNCDYVRNEKESGAVIICDLITKQSIIISHATAFLVFPSEPDLCLLSTMGLLRIWHLTEKKVVNEVAIDKTYCYLFTLENGCFVGITREGIIDIWDFQSFTILNSIEINREIYNARVSECGKQLAILLKDKWEIEIELWDLEKCQQIYRNKLYQAYYDTRINFYKNSLYIVGKKSLAIIADGQKQTHELHYHGSVDFKKMYACHQFLIFRPENYHRLVIFDLVDLEKPIVLHHNTKATSRRATKFLIETPPFYDRPLSGFEDRVKCSLDIHQINPLTHKKEYVGSVFVHSSLKVTMKSAYVYKSVKGAWITSRTTNESQSLLATASSDKKIRIFEVKNLINKSHDITFGGVLNTLIWGGVDSPLCTLSGHSDCVEHMAFHPNKDILITVAGHSMRFWDIKKRSCVGHLKSYLFGKISFNSDGSYILSGSYLIDVNTLSILFFPYTFKEAKFDENNPSVIFTKNENQDYFYWEIKSSGGKSFLQLRETTSNALTFTCQGLDISGAIGLSEENKAFLLQGMQGRAHGIPSNAKTESFQDLHQQRFFKPSLVQAQMRSKVDETQMINNKWALLTFAVHGAGDGKSSFNNITAHAFMILERIHAKGHYEALRIDLYNDSFFPIYGVARIDLVNWDFQQKSIKAYMKENECAYISYPIQPAQALALELAIRKDQQAKKIKYFVLGNVSSFKSSSQTPYHNCVSWCEEKFQEIGIKVDGSDHWHHFLAKIPRLYLHGMVTNENLIDQEEDKTIDFNPVKNH